MLPKQRIFEVLQATQFIATFSGHSRKKKAQGADVSKMVLKTIVIQGQPHYQINTYTPKQHYIKNLAATKASLDEALDAVMAHEFMQVHIQSPAADHYFRITHGGMSTRKTAPSRSNWTEEEHNKKKAYKITPQNSLELLCELGICNEKGSIHASMQAKYKQINHFLSIALTLEVLQQPSLRVIDCGCGKAYLSLALYHYVRNILGADIRLIGIDANATVIDFCQRTAQKLGYDNAEFLCQTIGSYNPDGDVDLLIALHACDTATDEALALGINANAAAILAAPCCHHYMNEKLRTTYAPAFLSPLLRDGITRERFADLLTDTMRRDVLRVKGYAAELIEFVAPEHTLKNIMIRAERSLIPDAVKEEILQQLREEREQWKAAPKVVELTGI